MASGGGDGGHSFSVIGMLEAESLKYDKVLWADINGDNHIAKDIPPRRLVHHPSMGIKDRAAVFETLLRDIGIEDELKAIGVGLERNLMWNQRNSWLSREKWPPVYSSSLALDAYIRADDGWHMAPNTAEQRHQVGSLIRFASRYLEFHHAVLVDKTYDLADDLSKLEKRVADNEMLAETKRLHEVSEYEPATAAAGLKEAQAAYRNIGLDIKKVLPAAIIDAAAKLEYSFRHEPFDILDWINTDGLSLEFSIGCALGSPAMADYLYHDYFQGGKWEAYGTLRSILDRTYARQLEEDEVSVVASDYDNPLYDGGTKKGWALAREAAKKKKRNPNTEKEEYTKRKKEAEETAKRLDDEENERHQRQLGLKLKREREAREAKHRADDAAEKEAEARAEAKEKLRKLEEYKREDREEKKRRDELRQKRAAQEAEEKTKREKMMLQRQRERRQRDLKAAMDKFKVDQAKQDRLARNREKQRLRAELLRSRTLGRRDTRLMPSDDEEEPTLTDSEHTPIHEDDDDDDLLANPPIPSSQMLQRGGGGGGGGGRR